MDIKIRLIERKDITGFHAALSSVALEQKYLLTTTPPPLENIRNFIEQNISRSHSQFVALDGQKVVAWADNLPSTRQSMTHVASLGMGVIKSYRNKGIGSILLQETVNHAWGKGLMRLELEVFANNEPAIHLYQKYGYLHEGVKQNARYLNGQYIDVMMMAQCRG